MRYMCKQDPRITFKLFYFTFNPKNKPGFRNLPFITWKNQDDGIIEAHKAIIYGHDLWFDKSRDEGATWMHLGEFLNHWLFISDSQFLVGSRKIELVDKGSNVRISRVDGLKLIINDGEKNGN